jgi:GNAT superfamily N-acetyltransferase
MAATIPTTEPLTARAGDTWQWRRDDLSSDYPASAWTLKYYFRNAAGYFDVTAAADGDEFAVSVAMATTAGYAVGHYDWFAVVESATERFQVDAGRLQVLPNMATAAAYDGRGFARKMLDAIEAALLSRATADQLDMVATQLGDRSLTRDRASLIQLRSQFMAEAKREEAAQNGTDSRRMLVRFG